MNKTQAILNHLRTHTGITSMEAFQLYGSTRLSDVIFRLKKKGYDIVSVQRDSVDRYGHACYFSEYRLNK